MPSDPEPPLTPESKEATGRPADLDKQIVELRGRISDLGFEMDAGKAVGGLMMGGGVFLLLLGGLGVYDLLNGKAGIYQPLGITRDLLQWIAWGCCGLGVAAIVQTLMRRRRRDHSRETELARLEEEYDRLKQRQESTLQKEK